MTRNRAYLFVGVERSGERPTARSSKSTTARWRSTLAAGSEARIVVCVLTDPAVADLERLAAIDPQIVRWALNKMLLLERDPEPGRPLLGGLIGWRKLVVGDRDWRIVSRITTDDAGDRVIDIAEVRAVGARADAEAYAETTDRITALGHSPTAQALSEVIERLGRVAGTATAASEPVPDPVPPWLVDRLAHQVLMRADAVAELTGAEAMQAWEAFITGR